MEVMRSMEGGGSTGRGWTLVGVNGSLGHSWTFVAGSLQGGYGVSKLPLIEAVERFHF